VSADAADAPRTHRGDGLVVESRLSLGVEPEISLNWTIAPEYVAARYTLMVFRASGGFSANPYPDDLSAHGTLIIETTEKGVRTDRLPEGTYFYTFALRKTYIFGLVEFVTLVRFSETVPSARTAIGRIKDQLELRDLAHRLEASGHEYEAKLNEAHIRVLESRRALERAKGGTSPGDPVLSKEVAAVKSIVETYLARRSVLDDLANDPKFQSLSPKERKAILKDVKARLDPREVSARRDMGS
jgi:hypothetical protein